MEESKGVMEELSRTIVINEPLSNDCSSVYFAIEQLSSVLFLCHFSLRFFLELFNTFLLNNPQLEGVKEERKRISILTLEIFKICLERVGRSLFNENKLKFALKLCSIFLKGNPDQIEQDQLGFVLKGEKMGIKLKQKKELVENLKLIKSTHSRLLAELVKIPNFSDLSEKND